MSTQRPSATSPDRVRFSTVVELTKDAAFEVCAALAVAEAVLARLGRPLEAARMAEVFETVERALTGEGLASRTGAQLPGAGSSVWGANSMASEFTQ